MLQHVGFPIPFKLQTRETEQASEKVIYFVIPNEVRNLSSI